MNAKTSISQGPQSIQGYTNGMLIVDLSNGKSSDESHDEAFVRKYLGDAALGIRYLFDEVP